jgi:hypothetical protein
MKKYFEEVQEKIAEDWNENAHPVKKVDFLKDVFEQLKELIESREKAFNDLASITFGLRMLQDILRPITPNPDDPVARAGRSYHQETIEVIADFLIFLGQLLKK